MADLSEAPVVPEVVVDQEGTHDITEKLSNKARRKLKDVKAIGGLRNPVTPVGRIPGWKATGKRISSTLVGLLDAHPDEIEHALSSVGAKESEKLGFSTRFVSQAQAALAKAFNVSLPADPLEAKAALLLAIVRDAGDPEIHVPAWARGQTPLGIVRRIPTCGVFPDAGEAGHALDEFADLVTMQEMPNYDSFYEHAGLVEAALEKDFAKGFCLWSESREELEQLVGPLILSRVAAIVKESAGPLKTRLIHVLSRSRVNRLAELPERVVLPRLMGAATSLLAVISPGSTVQDVEAAVCDFEDAFKQMFVNLDEQRFLAGKAIRNGRSGYFVYLSVLFGHIAGPLLWGRVAALLMRCTMATLHG